MSTVLITILGCFIMGPGLWIFLYFATNMYTSDQLDDMLDRGDINWIQHSNLYERMQIGEYKLYPQFLKSINFD